ncbi:hypothetical protein BH09SUM1_BH09SUM1_04600 [soil metagenome]
MWSRDHRSSPAYQPREDYQPDPDCDVPVTRNFALLIPDAGYPVVLVRADDASTTDTSPYAFINLPPDATEATIRYVSENSEESSEALVHWTKVPESGAFESKLRSPWLLIAYPMIGLPRDLLDAPWTAIRRTHFDLNEGGMESPAAGIGILVGAMGAPVICLIAITPLWVAIPAAIVSIIPGGYVGLLAGAILSNAIEAGFDLFERGIEVPVMRSGVDSLDYFPNWKFLIHRPIPIGAPKSYK